MGLGGNIRLLAIFNFFRSFNFYLPIQLVYFSKVTGSYSLAASVISAALISSAALEVPTGIFSDLIGRKKTIVLGTLCAIVAVTLYAIGAHYWYLLIGALFEGASKSFFSGNNDAYLHNILAEEGKENEYHHYYGKINSALTLASSTAALASGFLANISFALLMWASVIPQIASLIVSFQLGETKKFHGESSNVYQHLKEALGAIKSNYNLRMLSLSTILGNGAGLTAYQFQSVVINSVWPLWAIGIARALQEWGGIPGFYYAGRLINRFGALKITLFATIQSWLSNIIAAVFPSFFSPLFISSSAFFYGPSDTAIKSLLQSEFSEKQRATIASLNSLAGSIYFAIVAFGVGLFANQFGPFKALLLTQLLFTPCIFLQWVLFRKQSRLV
ncbi:MAG: MFS transporter [Candidatus Curtissbacteria bacterium]|nr:MFS transporter [Candidatus Curtissbacteria bacterium]